MTKFDYRTLSKAERDELLQELLTAMNAAFDGGVHDRFFMQLLTPSEAVMIARRWKIAQQLAAGHSYYRIRENTKAGISTIESVDRWLSEAIGDYKSKLVQASKLNRQRRRGGHVLTFPNMLPYLLLNLIAEGALQWWAAGVVQKSKKS